MEQSANASESECTELYGRFLINTRARRCMVWVFHRARTWRGGFRVMEATSRTGVNLARRRSQETGVTNKLG